MSSAPHDSYDFFDDNFNYNYNYNHTEPIKKTELEIRLKKCIDEIKANDKDAVFNPYNEKAYLAKVRTELLRRQHLDCATRKNIYEDNLRSVLFMWATILAIIAFIFCQILFRIFYILLTFLSAIPYYKVSIFFTVVTIVAKILILIYLFKTVFISMKHDRQMLE